MADLYCKVRCEPERHRYWAERAEKYYPGHETVHKIRVSIHAARGVTQYKRPYGDVLPTWVAKLASWYMWPLIEYKIWCMNGLIFQNFPKFEPKYFRKFWKNLVILLEMADWYMNGSLLEKIGICMVYFQILRWHIPTKTKLEYPPDMQAVEGKNLDCET